MAIVSVENLTKQYEQRGKKSGLFTAVDHISFTIEKGEIFGILGPNGAGKTTTLEMIEGLRPMTDGSVTVAGIVVADDPRGVKERIGVQLQESEYFDNMSLVELLELFGVLYHRRVSGIALLEQVQLVDKKDMQVKHLSGGQKQRFSIASALVNDPAVLFMDEPTTGLDPQARRNLWDLVRDIRAKGTTIVLTTHYMEEAEVLCDRVAIMDSARIIALDTPEKLIATHATTTDGTKGTLEDVFIQLTGKELRE
jgi:ABC-2 type transport system ATP-binding protein